MVDYDYQLALLLEHHWKLSDLNNQTISYILRYHSVSCCEHGNETHVWAGNIWSLEWNFVFFSFHWGSWSRSETARLHISFLHIFTNFLYHKSSSLDLHIRNRDETISSTDDNLFQIDQYTDDKVDKWCHHKISDNNLMSQSHRFSLKLSRITATLQRVDLDMKYFIFTNNTKCQYNRMCVSVFCPR